MEETQGLESILNTTPVFLFPPVDKNRYRYIIEGPFQVLSNQINAVGDIYIALEK